jgi:hypothetical protein
MSRYSVLFNPNCQLSSRTLGSFRLVARMLECSHNCQEHSFQFAFTRNETTTAAMKSTSTSQAQNTGTHPLTLRNAILQWAVSSGADHQVLPLPNSSEPRAVRRTGLLMILDLVTKLIDEDEDEDEDRCLNAIIASTANRQGRSLQ